VSLRHIQSPHRCVKATFPRLAPSSSLRGLSTSRARTRVSTGGPRRMVE
jgi:hypothetical protein